MAEERVNQKEAESPDESPTSAQRPTESEDHLKPPSAYDTLMRQHRDAILRVHTLETENENLMNLLKRTLSGNAFSFVDEAANPTELLSRVKALEGRDEPAVDQSASLPPATSAEASRASDHEIEQLRVLNQTLVGQVSKLDSQLQEIKTDRSRRRRRSSSHNRKRGMFGRFFGR